MEQTQAYQTVYLSHTNFTLPGRYERLEFIGSGAFSSIVKASDRQLGGCRVAIKKLARPFQSPDHARRAYRELQLLSTVSHPNLIHLLHAFSPQLTASAAASAVAEVTTPTLQDIYLVMPYMDCDLAKLLVARGRLKCREAAKVIYGVLNGLSYLHSAGILHRDLKPSNVALDTNGGVKILDFGLARVTAGNTISLTGYVCTRSYRSPELLTSSGYGSPVDVWSAGCILAECLLGRVLFPAANPCHLLRDMYQLLGKPDLANAVTWLSADAAKYIASLEDDVPMQQQSEFSSTFAHVRRQPGGPAFCELLRQMLAFEPAARITAQAAMAHSALKKQQQQQQPNSRGSLLTAQQGQPSPRLPSEPIIDEGCNDDAAIQRWRALIGQLLTELAMQSDS